MKVVNNPPAGSNGLKIPIRNLWHMLFYAWNEPSLKTDVMLGEIESAPSLDALFAILLVRIMQQRMRIGLGRAYVNGTNRLRAVRGRVNFAESLKHLSFENGEADCVFQQFSADEPRNQVIRSTLRRLIQTGEFGPDRVQADALRQRLRWLVRNLEGIGPIELDPDFVNRLLGIQNDHDYRLMLSICEMFLLRHMPIQTDGIRQIPGFDRDVLLLYHIYERFIAGFYRVHLRGWEVIAQKRLEWHAQDTSGHLPSMIPDLVLQNRSTGHIIILDTKFTLESFVENRWGKPVYDSSHLYQLYSYLRSQEHLSEEYRTASGILLYPAAQYKFSESVQLQDHIIRMACVDLAVPWQDVESQLLDIVTP